MDYQKVHNSYLDLVENYKNEIEDVCKHNHKVTTHNMRESLVYNLMTLVCNHKYTKNLAEIEAIALLLTGWCYFWNLNINENE